MSLSPDVYVKRLSLISWDPQDSGSIAALVLQETEACEILKHPHPSVAKYHGCFVEDGGIVGLCFAYYTQTITQWLNRETNVTDPDRLACCRALESGIRHLHRLGLAHNDINPSNIVMDSENRPVIIDFDSARPIGEELGSKAGTVGWELEDAELCAKE